MGKLVDLPNDTKGKYTLLGLAFSKKSEDDLNTWVEPVYWKFIDKPEGKNRSVVWQWQQL